MSKPLFILGKHRSGTTFLSNLLSEHPAVAAVISDRECGGIVSGVFESGFFNYINGRYGDISNFENYMEFISTASCMEYFRLANCSLEELLNYYPADYPVVFREIMERFASEKDAVYWMEKSPENTINALRIKSYYPDAKFVGIYRNEVDSALSSLYLKKKQNKSRFFRLVTLLKVTYMKFLYDQSMKKLNKRYPDDVFLLSYESLVNNTTSRTSEICEFLGIKPCKLTTPYKKNTSFRTTAKEDLYSYERKIIRFFYRIGLRAIPDFFLKMFYMLYCRFKTRQIPAWFFRTYRMSLSKDQRKHFQK